ncbi:MAG: HAD family hydrolase [Rectinemataceae bacterium]
MKIIRLPADPRLVEGMVFDLDNTLYTNPAYAKYQEDVLVECLGRALGVGGDAARERIERMRAERRRAGLAPTSLGNLSAELGFDIATSVRWREENLDPGAWLPADERLEETLRILSRHFALALVSNNPRLVVEKSLNALGVRDTFKAVVGLDSTLKSKPETEPFELALRLLDLRPEVCLSIGDRFDVDLAPALALGMGGILVTGVEDVYRLPEIFAL